MLLSEIKNKGRYSIDLKNFYNKPIIYKLTFTNNKVYIGQTINLKRRLYNYLSKNNKSNHFVKKAILKYTLNNVNFEVLEICNSEHFLNEREVYYISLYKSYDKMLGYNLDYGGKGGKPTPQTILKKINSSKKVKVGQYDLQGNLIKIFNSVKETSRILNISDTDIHRACKRHSTRNGFMFSKTLSDKIEPLFYKIQKGKWNLKKYKITNIINSEITIIEGLNNVAIFINSGRDYVDNIIKRKTIFNKKFKVEKYEC